MGKLVMLRSYKAWEIIEINHEDYRIDFLHSGWQQTKDRCAECQSCLESTRLLKIKRIKNLNTRNIIESGSQEALIVKKELANSLKERCLNCWHRKKRKKIRQQKTPSSPTYALKNF